MRVRGIEEKAKLIRSPEPTECSASAVLLHTDILLLVPFVYFYSPLIVPELKKKPHTFWFRSFFFGFFFFLIGRDSMITS